MRRNRFLAVAVLGALVMSAIFFVSAPTARAAIGPKTIMVDGNPSDWTGVPGPMYSLVESNNEAIETDGVGDDTGDGDYTYPKAADLNVTGLFDMREVRFAADATNLYVLIRVGDLNNPWGGGDGFSTVSFVLLISTDQNMGGGQTAARPNVNVDPSIAWEYWAKIGQSGWHGENAKVFDAAGKWAPIVNQGNATQDVVEASIPLSFMGKDGYSPDNTFWRFAVFIGGFDGGGPNGFRNVAGAPWCCDWEFGGGADHPYDPQVIDMVGEANLAQQVTQLSSYTTSTPATMMAGMDVNFGAIGFAADTTAPTITNPSASATFNSAQVAWDTNEPANTTVRWGTTSGALANRDGRDEFVAGHTVTLTSLNEQTTYYYQIESCDWADNCATTAEASFTTPAAPPSNIAAWVGPMFTWKDRAGDDVGDGDYGYPQTGLVDWYGRADLTWFNMTKTATALHINAKLNANPETQWKQRMGTVAIFIDQDNTYDSGARWVSLVGTGAELTDPHPMNLSVAPNFAWEYLVVANFQNGTEVGRGPEGEMFVFNNVWNAAQQRWTLIYLSTAPGISPEPNTGQIFAKNGNEVDIWLNFSVIGTGDDWTFVVATMLFDDAARAWDQGGVRQVREAPSDWAGSGSNGPHNPNAYDIAFYPDTPSQTEDLSNYTSGQYANLTRAVRVHFAAQTHDFLHASPLTHDYAVAVASNRTTLGNGQRATITATVTDNGSPVQGAEVTLSASPSAAGTIVGSQVLTTDANGEALFTFEGAEVSQDTTVTFTATATNGTADAGSGTGSLTVEAPEAPPPPPSGIDPLLIAGVVILLVIVVAAIALLMRKRKPASTPPETPSEPEEPKGT